MAFLIVVNHTTGTKVSGAVDFGDQRKKFGPLASDGAEQIALNNSDKPRRITVTVTGAPHNGKSHSKKGYVLDAPSAGILEITQNGYVNYFIEKVGDENAPIG